MQNTLIVEELVVNDSFISYCYRRNQEAISHWENYLLLFPDQKNNLDQARSMVLGISEMFREQEYNMALSELKSAVLLRCDTEETQKLFYMGERLAPPEYAIRKYIGYAVAAAAVLIGLVLFLLPAKQHENRQIAQQPDAANHSAVVYETNYREKRVIWLPDSSKVVLNAMSTLKIAEGFGINNRAVYLTGEALFDIVHNKKMPFTVNMPSFNVKVLGTLFNIKAYPEDRIQETSLIRGSVEVVIRDKENSTFFLRPNEKVIIPNKEIPLDAASEKKNNQPHIGVHEQVPVIIPLTISSSDSLIVETSWIYDRLDIYNKKFSEIKTDLERRYKVSINFKDSKVADYRFSATFEKETIEQVLQALQLSYPFHYSIEKNKITLSK